MSPGRREALILGGAGLAAAAAGFLVGPLILGGGGRGRPAEDGATLLQASFPDLQGRPRHLSEWRGRALVCNFWATWCAPCREEIPLLIALRRKYGAIGVEIVGIAVDNREKVLRYAEAMKIDYPILLAEADGIDLMRKLGNSAGGLPYTVVVDRKGAVAHRKLGAVKEGELEVILGPLVAA